MKSMALVGVVLLVLGLLSFVVPVPHSENHGVKIGDAKIAFRPNIARKCSGSGNSPTGWRSFGPGVRIP